MTYYQCLLKNGIRYSLVWLPSEYCVEDSEIVIKNIKYLVKEVYRSLKDEYYDGKNLLWKSKAHELKGEKLQERLKLNRRMIKLNQIQTTRGKYGNSRRTEN